MAGIRTLPDDERVIAAVIAGQAGLSRETRTIDYWRRVRVFIAPMNKSRLDPNSLPEAANG